MTPLPARGFPEPLGRKERYRTHSYLENAENFISWVPTSALTSVAKDRGGISLSGPVRSLGAIRGPPVRSHNRPANTPSWSKALQIGLEGIGAENNP